MVRGYNPKRSTGPRRSLNNGGAPMEPPSVSLDEALARRGSINSKSGSLRSEETVVRAGGGNSGYTSDDAIASGRRVKTNNSAWLFDRARRTAVGAGGQARTQARKSNGRTGDMESLLPQKMQKTSISIGNSDVDIGGSRNKNAIIVIISLSIMIMALLHLGEFGSPTPPIRTRAVDYVVRNEPVLSNEPFLSNEPVFSNEHVFSNEALVSHAPVFSDAPVVNNEADISNESVYDIEAQRLRQKVRERRRQKQRNSNEPVLSNEPVFSNEPVLSSEFLFSNEPAISNEASDSNTQRLRQQKIREERRQKLRQEQKKAGTWVKSVTEGQDAMDMDMDIGRDLIDTMESPSFANLMDISDNSDNKEDFQAILSSQDILSSLGIQVNKLDETQQEQMMTQEEDERAETWSELFLEVAEVQHQLAALADAAHIQGNPAFCIHPRNGDKNAAFQPSEILIEVLNPKPDCSYSVTVVSEGRYTGTAMLMSELPPGLDGTVIMQEPGSLLHSWSPVFMGHYEVLVHEIDPTYDHETPLIQPPFPILISEKHVGLGLSLLQERVQTMPPCQLQDDINTYSQWDGDWLGPEFGLNEQIRTGWSFLPSRRMNCKLETFTQDALRAIPEKKSIYILGRSVERGIFLSLADMLLDYNEAKRLKDSVIGKCWGRASVSKGNLELMYQDFRVNAFEDPTEPRYIECHNDNLVKQPGSSFIENATAVWEEVFNKDESTWPSVIFLTTGLGSSQFLFEHHVLSFVKTLPQTWRGTLFLGDFQFSARAAGFVNTHEYEAYLQEIQELSNQLNDPRIRWIDGIGISKEMRMYGQKGQYHIARSQHFHHSCPRKDMVMCSNVTEIVGQLLLGHALGPKEEFIQQVKESMPSISHSTAPAKWCHACPKCMLPFHITPYPEMTCVTGAIGAKTSNDDCVAIRFEGSGGEGGGVQLASELMCPRDCLESDAISSFDTESDTVFVRQCPIIM